MVFKLIIFTMYLIAGRPLFSQIPFIVFMLIHAYGLWVVNNYIEELNGFKYEKELTARQMRSRDESVCSVSERVNGIEKLAKKRKEQYEMGKEGQGEHNEGCV